MKNFVRVIIFILAVVLTSGTVFSQTIDYIKPPSQENTYLFKVVKYHRQPAPPKYIRENINRIEKKPTTQWNAQDSLYYAFENVYLEEFELALSIFSKLNIDTIQEKHAKMLYRTTLQHLERYETLKTYNQKTIKENPSAYYSINKAVMDLNNAYIKFKEGTFIPDSTVIFPILNDPALKELNATKSPTENKFVEISFAIDSAFRHFSILHDKTDYILAKAFEEMGDFQKEYFYLTNALFYYSAARHFYVADKDIVEKYNDAHDEMNEHNYISISIYC